MIQHLTESEKKRIDAFRKRGLNYPNITAEIVVGRYLMEFVHLQSEVETYIKEVEKRNEKRRLAPPLADA